MHSYVTEMNVHVLISKRVRGLVREGRREQGAGGLLPLLPGYRRTPCLFPSLSKGSLPPPPLLGSRRSFCVFPRLSKGSLPLPTSPRLQEDPLPFFQAFKTFPSSPHPSRPMGGLVSVCDLENCVVVTHGIISSSLTFGLISYQNHGPSFRHILFPVPVHVFLLV